MTNKEIIYNALGMIEGAVCVSQKNTREVLMKAIEMIKDAIEEKTECECECDHQWVVKEVYECGSDSLGKARRLANYVCTHCGKMEFRHI